MAAAPGTVAAVLALIACLTMDSGAAASQDDKNRAETVVTGAERLVDQGFATLKGRRVGLIANHTTTVRGRHLADLIHEAPDVTLVSLFGPEHGLRGTGAAGEKILDSRDKNTGVKVYSLYGKTLKPGRQMLTNVDVLVFDIQDIGARFYTFISTMGLAMQAAAQQNIKFIVLDRPNPLGGDYVAGFTTRPDHVSFVSQFAIPLAHGLTVGELARMIKGDKLLPGLEKLDLEVIEMTGWKRAMLWPDTDRPWVPTSPAIPDFETALIYPGAGFFEATAASEGRGTDAPFKLLGSSWANGELLAFELSKRRLPGVRFEAAKFTPRSQPDQPGDPKLKDWALEGVRITITDIRAYKPVETGVHLLHAFRKRARIRRALFIDRPEWLAKLSGSTKLNGMLRRDESAAAIIAAWKDDVSAFRKSRKPYLLYE